MADTKRYRNFCLMSYCTEEQIKKVMQKHDHQLKAHAYILHDKDLDENGKPKTAHYHILLALVNATTVDAVRNWFNFTDSNGLKVNTLGQQMHDTSGSFDYLTHETDESREQGKYIYPATDIKGFNLEYFKDESQLNADSLTSALDDMLNGISLIDIYKRYGRDFIVHYGHIKSLFNDIQTLTGGKTL